MRNISFDPYLDKPQKFLAQKSQKAQRKAFFTFFYSMCILCILWQNIFAI